MRKVITGMKIRRKYTERKRKAVTISNAIAIP
jgi:hypothetical protein